MRITVGPIGQVRVRAYSLAFKITVLCVASIMGALTLSSALFLWQDWAADCSDLATGQLDAARSLATAASLALEKHDLAAAAAANAIFQNDDDALAASYVSTGGRRLAMARPGQSSTDAAAFSASQAVAFRNGYIAVHVPVIAHGRKTGEMFLVASEAEIWRSFRRNVLWGLGLALFSAALSGAVARAFVRRALRPLRGLEQAMERIGETKDFSVPIDVKSNDELGDFIGDFNALLAALNHYDTDLKRTMSELTLAKDAAEDANVMKSQFLANMSHEIRTPLNGVMGIAQVMAMNPLSNAQRERLEIIQESSATLLSVLNDLLDLSKIEAGRMELEQAPFDIEEVASGAYSAFTSIANASGVSFSLDIAPAAAGRWRGDSVRVRQILYNLISNALKFTHEGQVQVRIDKAPFQEGQALSITVADTGIGIAADVLPKLFEKFVQADNSMTRRFGGTGLGLTICRHIAGLMGGAITVESTLGEGTTFEALLPLPWIGPAIQLAVPMAASDVDSSPDCGLEGLRILAAEDNATNRLVLKTILHSLGLQPMIVANGRQAVEAWSKAPFDLILMDIQMPELDGVAATREIRAREALRGAARTPIVALSANAMKHQVAEYLAAGMDAHLAKPIQIERLYATLFAVLNGQSLREDESQAA